MVTGARRARLNPRRATALCQQSWVSCSQAPRPGSLVSGSGTSAPSTLAKRSSSERGARARQPTHVLPRPTAVPTRSGDRPLGDDVGVLAGERLVRVQAAVARSRERGVRAAPAVPEDRGAAAAGLLLLVAGVLLLLGELGLRADVDAPAGQAGGEAGVLALAADRERQLVVGHDHRRLAVLVVDQHLADARRAERLRDEPRGLVVVGDDVDLLAAQLGHHHAHARAARADAGTDGIDAVGVRDDRDLRAVAGLAGDVRDLDQAVGDLRHLELEQLLDQLRVAPGHDDARPARRGRDLLDHRLDALGVVVALAVDLLRLRQQRLDALAQLNERVARVRLLDDARDQLPDAVLVLLEHHVALGLADPLEDHLLGRLRGDPAEVVRRHVALLDLVLELGEARLRDLRRLGDDHLAGLGVDAPLELAGRLLLGLVEQLVLELHGQDQLLHAVIAKVGVEVHARVADGVGLLLVGREQRVLQGGDELLLGDALLPCERAYGLDDLL